MLIARSGKQLLIIIEIITNSRENTFRYIINTNGGYELSDTLDTAPVLAAVTNAMEQYGNPEIINSDQGKLIALLIVTSFAFFIG